MQNTYSIYSTPLVVGQLTDKSLKQIDGFTAETIIQFGQPVKFGTKQHQVKVLDAITAGICCGFAVRNEERTTGQYEISSQVDVIRLGRIAIVVKEAVAALDDAYVYADATIGKTTNNGLKIGKFLTAGSGAGAIVELQIQLLY